MPLQIPDLNDTSRESKTLGFVFFCENLRKLSFVILVAVKVISSIYENVNILE
jgi:hypothetical protein